MRFGPGLNEMNSRFRVLDWPAAANFLKRRGTFSIVWLVFHVIIFTLKFSFLFYLDYSE